MSIFIGDLLKQQYTSSTIVTNQKILDLLRRSRYEVRVLYDAVRRKTNPSTQVCACHLPTSKKPTNQQSGGKNGRSDHSCDTSPLQRRWHPGDCRSLPQIGICLCVSVVLNFDSTVVEKDSGHFSQFPFKFQERASADSRKRL